MNGNEKANLCCENFGNYVVVKNNDIFLEVNTWI